MRGFFLWEKIEFFQREVKELNTTVSLTPRTQNIFKLGHGALVSLFGWNFPHWRAHRPCQLCMLDLIIDSALQLPSSSKRTSVDFLLLHA